MGRRSASRKPLCFPELLGACTLAGALSTLNPIKKKEGKMDLIKRREKLTKIFRTCGPE